MCLPADAGWKVDLSRRRKDLVELQSKTRAPAEVKQGIPESSGFLDAVFDFSQPIQEIVVLNSDSGFIPSQLNLKQGIAYKISVVNVNAEKKNVSFVMDTFSQHHATYYGEIKSFHIQPKAQGIFSFVCPETAAKGRIVVKPGAGGVMSAPEIRMPAAE